MLDFARAVGTTARSGQPKPEVVSENRLVVAEAVQIVGESIGTGVALGGLLLKAFQAHRLQVTRHLRLQPARRHRLLEAHLFQRVHQTR